jgi:hypothetical protein
MCKYTENRNLLDILCLVSQNMKSRRIEDQL